MRRIFSADFRKKRAAAARVRKSTLKKRTSNRPRWSAATPSRHRRWGQVEIAVRAPRLGREHGHGLAVKLEELRGPVVAIELGRGPPRE